MVRPPLLKQGDTIAITAPARKINNNDVNHAIAMFESWGLKVRLSDHLFSSKHSYLSGNDAERLEDIQTLIDDNSVKAIISARGGYGSSRILDKINFEPLQKNPKWIVGFSDITAIQLALLSNELQSIHGTMPILFGRPGMMDSIESLRKILFEGSFELRASSCSGNRDGNTTGTLVGGNLSLVIDSLGTQSEIQTDNAILLIEEIDEYYYRLDRMIIHLKRAGKLSKLRGLAVGHFTDLKESELPFKESYKEIILQAVAEYQYPVAFEFPTGHDTPNYAWIQGENVSLIANRAGSLITPLSKQIS